MDILNGNRKLEEAIFTGLDYALYSRSDINDTFAPFMLLFKNGKYKLNRVISDGDPNVAFKEVLDKDNSEYDQIVMCFEGTVPHEHKKYDAVIVKGFDTSEKNGKMFIQRFRGIESGESFMKLGNPVLVSVEELLPVKLIERNTNKTIEKPYISGIVVNEESGLINRKIIAGHTNASILANYLFDVIIGAVEKEENDFTGRFEIHFVPDTIQNNGFSNFIFHQLKNDLKNNQCILNWEQKNKRMVEIVLKYNDNEPSIYQKNKMKSKETITKSNVQQTISNHNKPWWKFW